MFNKKHNSILGIGSCVERIITESETLGLEKEFNEIEVELALSELANDKVSGPDGSNIHFIKFFWKNLKSQIMECFRNFWANRELPLGFNSSFIALIPKISHPKLIQDYGPISLINSISKLLTKLLANRLTTLSSKVFDHFQFGFLKGRQAAESIIIVHEIHHSIKIDSSRGMILKLDFEKASDSVRWDFMLPTMEKMGFGMLWIMWIKKFLKSTRLSLLLNGSPISEFCMSNGVRQGDPLSPYLFNIAGGVLSLLIRKANKLGLIRGIVMGHNHFSE